MPGRRMIVIQIPPEHVLYAIGGIENAGAETLRCFFEGIKEHLFARVMIGIGLLEEGVVIQHFFVERPCILGESKSSVGTE